MDNLSYKTKMEIAINRVNTLRKVKPTGNLNEKVKKVAVILCGSRNGSSLMKTILSKSQDVAYLSGEEEPFYILTGNGFPWSSTNDGFYNIQNKQLLLDCIFDEMGVNTISLSIEDIKHNWKNRIPLQSPGINRNKLTTRVDEIWNDLNQIKDDYTYHELCQLFLKEFYRGMQDFGYYDIIPENTPFLVEDVNRLKIEEPPFVIPEYRRPITEQDCEDKTFIFKTPQDCYRIGIFEQLFPNAEIKYVHLSRGFAQAVNGLMDGWLSETGFFAHNMDMIGERLEIKGYSEKITGGDRWWNFDLPSNWKEYKDKPLENVCLNQWYQAHKSIINSGVNALRVKFESFTLQPQETLDTVTEYLGIGNIKSKKLPLIMVTETPSDYRWHKRKETILELAKHEKVQKLMIDLGYSMDPQTWI